MWCCLHCSRLRWEGFVKVPNLVHGRIKFKNRSKQFQHLTSRTHCSIICKNSQAWIFLNVELSMYHLPGAQCYHEFDWWIVTYLCCCLCLGSFPRSRYECWLPSPSATFFPVFPDLYPLHGYRSVLSKNIWSGERASMFSTDLSYFIQLTSYYQKFKRIKILICRRGRIRTIVLCVAWRKENVHYFNWYALLLDQMLWVLKCNESVSTMLKLGNFVGHTFSVLGSR